MYIYMYGCVHFLIEINENQSEGINQEYVFHFALSTLLWVYRGETDCRRTETKTLGPSRKWLYQLKAEMMQANLWCHWYK
jgi:hypothetical protein